jgi:hypothetical protein
VKRFEAAIEIRHPESVCITQVFVCGDDVQQKPQAGGERDRDQGENCESMAAHETYSLALWSVGEEFRIQNPEFKKKEAGAERSHYSDSWILAPGF